MPGVSGMSFPSESALKTVARLIGEWPVDKDTVVVFCPHWPPPPEYHVAELDNEGWLAQSTDLLPQYYQTRVLMHLFLTRSGAPFYMGYAEGYMHKYLVWCTEDAVKMHAALGRLGGE
jgi:hypothetical protein